MIRKKFKSSQQTQVRVKANWQVRFPELRVLDEKGNMLGLMSSDEAFKQAKEQEKDLVLVTEQAKPPVAKIIELSKYKYQLKQKQAKDRKSSRAQDTKEIRFSMFIGQNDFDARMKKIHAFIKRGDKVKLTLNFKGRQIAKKEFAYDIFKKIFEQTQETAQVEMEPKFVGNKLIAQIRPNKK